jgi:hypothetical protein
VAAPLDECFALLAAVDRYPEWCPAEVRSVEVLELGAGGQPRRVRMMLHVARGTIVKEFQLLLAIAVQAPRSVVLTRVTDHPTDQEFTAVWQLNPGSRTRIALRLDARLRVPAFVPAGGIPDEVANGFVTAASRALGRETAQPIPR